VTIRRPHQLLHNYLFDCFEAGGCCCECLVANYYAAIGNFVDGDEANGGSWFEAPEDADLTFVGSINTNQLPYYLLADVGARDATSVICYLWAFVANPQPHPREQTQTFWTHLGEFGMSTARFRPTPFFWLLGGIIIHSQRNANAIIMVTILIVIDWSYCNHFDWWWFHWLSLSQRLYCHKEDYHYYHPHQAWMCCKDAEGGLHLQNHYDDKNYATGLVQTNPFSTFEARVTAASPFESSWSSW